MGKLIQFPIAARVARRAPKRHEALAFEAFGEMQHSERAQLKLLAACTAGAALLMLALQLVTG